MRRWMTFAIGRSKSSATLTGPESHLPAPSWWDSHPALKVRDLLHQVFEHPFGVGSCLVGDLLQGPENYRTGLLRVAGHRIQLFEPGASVGECDVTDPAFPILLLTFVKSNKLRIAKPVI